MSLRGLCLFAAVLAISPAHALTLKAPDVAENGAVIPVDVTLNSPLTAGQQLEVMVNGQVAARVRVSKGKVRSFNTRVKGSHNSTTIAARVMAGGREVDSGSRNLRVTMPAQVTGSPSAAGPIKMRSGGGSVRLLITSQNGYAGTLVLNGSDLQVEIDGSTSMSRNPLIGVGGDFSGNVTASINGNTTVAAVYPQQNGGEAARARDEMQAQQRREEQARMERQQAERARAQREKQAREAEETRQAWGQFTNALVQYQQARHGRPTTQQRPTQAQGYPASTQVASNSTGMSAQQIADCDADIKSKQIESQRWSGSSIEVANRLGRYQKDLFEGRCAGHPEATAYIRSADKMLSYRQDPAKTRSSSGAQATPRVGSTQSGNTGYGGSNGSRSPASSSSKRQKIYAGVQNQCIKFTPGKPPKPNSGNVHWFTYYNGCSVTIKVCDNMSGRGWGCGYEIKPHQSTRNWDSTPNINRNGGKFYACNSEINGQTVHFDKERLVFYYYSK